MKLKTVVTFLYLVISVPLFLFVEMQPLVWLSFFANFFVLTIIVNYHLNFEKNYSPFMSSFIIFTYLFFLVAPIIQIGDMSTENPIFPNRYPYHPQEVIFANAIIFLFNIVFFLSYVLMKKRIFKMSTQPSETSNTYTKPLFIVTLFVISILIVVLNYDFLIDEFERSTYARTTESVASLLIKKKVLFLIPLGAIAICYNYLSKKKKLTPNFLTVAFILIGLVVCLLILKNPFTEKRNALGPIYITLLFIFGNKLINSNVKFFLFMFISMVILFPLTSAITHVDATFDQVWENPHLLIESFVHSGGIANAFNMLHYDAFGNIMATADYIGKNGFSLGFQLLSAFLFFVPRGVWPSKPISSGELVGNYLIEDYGFRYSNLSNPFVSEGFLNYGILGVIVFAILLPYVILKFSNWLYSADYLKKIIAFYLAVHLMFLLRGDFTNGFSYFIGTFLGVYFVPKLVDRILTFSLKK